MGFIFSKIYKVFFSKKLELCILGLENCGKTTFVNQLMGDAKTLIQTQKIRNVKNVRN